MTSLFLQFVNWSDSSSQTPKKQTPPVQTEEERKEEEKIATQKRFQEVFGFPIYERVHQAFNCSYWKTVLVPGKVYVSDNNVCFEDLTGLSSNVVIPIKEIFELKLASSSLLSPTSILVNTAMGQHWFSTFYDINEALAVMQKCWKMKQIPSETVKPKQTKEILRLPQEETDIIEHSATFYRKIGTFEGTLVVSKNFVGFFEKRKLSDKAHKFLIPYFIMEGVFASPSVNNPSVLFLAIKMKSVEKAFVFLLPEVESVIKLIDERKKSAPQGVSLLSWDRSCQTEYFDEYIKGWRFSSSFQFRQDEARKRWEAYFQANGQSICMIHTKDMTDLCRIDIPWSFCAHIWAYCSGALFKQAANPGYYLRILKQNEGKDSLALREIEKDLHRTFPNHSFVQKEGIAVMRRILSAYSWRNPSVGYCQSMNYVCTFLMFLLPEEQVFWLLCAICENLLPNYYSHDLLEPRVDQLAFEKMLETNLPEVWKKLDQLKINPIIFVFPWFLCLFICHFPLEGLMLILNRFFNEGKKVLFQITLAIFDVAQTQILDLNVTRSDEIEKILRNCRANNWKEIWILSRTKYTEISNIHIQRIRQPFKAEVTQEIIKQKRLLKLKDLIKNTNFDPFELEELHETFYRLASPFSSTVIDLPQFQDVCFPLLFPFWKDRPEIAPPLFHLIDTNNDSLMEFSEYVLCLSLLYRNKLSERFSFCQKLHDPNGKGIFDKTVVYNILDSFVRIFAVSGYELKLANLVNDLFRMVDTDDGDGAGEKGERERSTTKVRERERKKEKVITSEQMAKHLNLEKFLANLEAKKTRDAVLNVNVTIEEVEVQNKRSTAVPLLGSVSPRGMSELHLKFNRQSSSSTPRTKNQVPSISLPSSPTSSVPSSPTSSPRAPGSARSNLSLLTSASNNSATPNMPTASSVSASQQSSSSNPEKKRLPSPRSSLMTRMITRSPSLASIKHQHQRASDQAGESLVFDPSDLDESSIRSSGELFHPAGTRRDPNIDLSDFSTNNQHTTTPPNSVTKHSPLNSQHTTPPNSITKHNPLSLSQPSLNLNNQKDQQEQQDDQDHQDQDQDRSPQRTYESEENRRLSMTSSSSPTLPPMPSSPTYPNRSSLPLTKSSIIQTHKPQLPRLSLPMPSPTSSGSVSPPPSPSSFSSPPIITSTTGATHPPTLASIGSTSSLSLFAQPTSTPSTPSTPTSTLPSSPSAGGKKPAMQRAKSTIEGKTSHRSKKDVLKNRTLKADNVSPMSERSTENQK